MKLTPEDIKELFNYVSLVEDFKPLFKEILKILESYGIELNEIIKKLNITLAENKMETIKYYQDNGFTREESILLTINSNHALKEALRNTKINK